MSIPSSQDIPAQTRTQSLVTTQASLSTTATPSRVTPVSQKSKLLGDTPLSKSSTANTIDGEFVTDGLGKSRRAGVLRELEGHTAHYSTDWVEKVYLTQATDEAITAFLDQERDEPLYDTEKKEWCGVASASLSGEEKKLYAPLQDIVTAVLQEVGGVSSAHHEVVICGEKHIYHKEDDPTCTDYTKPDLLVKAVGPSFELPGGNSDIGYTNAATVIEVKFSDNSKEWNETFMTGQIGSYGRQMLIQQPNRMFVRCMAINKDSCRLFHFDRSGLQIAPSFNYHKKPGTFIRAILGLCSLKEEVLGFDTSIKWRIVDGMKEEGKITIDTKDFGKMIYTLAETAPEIRSYTIRGRATTCWRVNDPDSDGTLMIKYSWRSAGRTQEWVHLEKAKGIDGVCQMITYGAREVCNTDWRRLTTENESAPSREEGFHPRAYTCVVLEGYSAPISKFRSQYALLAAICDALEGHLELWERKGILHRDISIWNILLGRKGAPHRLRGHLVDLDMAVPSERAKEDICMDPRTGSFLFKSIALLQNCNEKLKTEIFYPNHNQLDDLESFYYVLYILMRSRKPNGTCVPPSELEEEEMQHWSLDSPSRVASSKRSHLSEEELSLRAFHRLGWLRPATYILQEFHKIIVAIYRRKRIIGRMEEIEEQVPQLERLVQESASHFRTVISVFKKGIQDFERLPDNNDAGSTSTIDASAPGPSSIAPVAPSITQPIVSLPGSTLPSYQPRPKRTNSWVEFDNEVEESPTRDKRQRRCVRASRRNQSRRGEGSS